MIQYNDVPSDATTEIRSFVSPLFLLFIPMYGVTDLEIPPCRSCNIGSQRAAHINSDLEQKELVLMQLTIHTTFLFFFFFLSFSLSPPAGIGLSFSKASSQEAAAGATSKDVSIKAPLRVASPGERGTIDPYR